MGLKDFVGCIQDPRRKALVESVLEAFQRDLIDSKVSESFPTSIIHGKLLIWLGYLCLPVIHVFVMTNVYLFHGTIGDFNDANMLVDSNFLVSGVIDFGDSVER
jgi:hypothetical protein